MRACVDMRRLFCSSCVFPSSFWDGESFLRFAAPTLLIEASNIDMHNANYANYAPCLLMGARVGEGKGV